MIDNEWYKYLLYGPLHTQSLLTPELKQKMIREQQNSQQQMPTARYNYN